MIRSQTDLSKALEECTSNAACASFLADYDLDEVPLRLFQIVFQPADDYHYFVIIIYHLFYTSPLITISTRSCDDFLSSNIEAFLTWLSFLIAGFSDGRRLHQHRVQDARGDYHATIWSLIHLGHESGHGHPHRHQQPHRQRHRGEGGEQHSKALLTPSSTILMKISPPWGQLKLMFQRWKMVKTSSTALKGRSKTQSRTSSQRSWDRWTRQLIAIRCWSFRTGKLQIYNPANCKFTNLQIIASCKFTNLLAGQIRDPGDGTAAAAAEQRHPTSAEADQRWRRLRSTRGGI